ncbi:MAG: ferrous iron transporter B [Defluviitaleaceae bacterium]|nr:ferrous iron transporter B [Defluviitaleaceae bacterium]
MEVNNKILLMGNPNVGKSIFFTELTGIHTVSSNFAGTTVTFMEGQLTLGETGYVLIDVPGTYSLTPSSEAEAVATRLMGEGAAAVVCVLDASNLARNLQLAMELRQYKIPMVYAVNLSDVAKRKGISINVKLLEQELGAPVVETIAVKNEGFETLREKLTEALKNPTHCENEAHCGLCTDKWQSANEIARRVTRKDSERLGFLDKLGTYMVAPFPGVPIAFAVLALLVGVVVFGGRLLRMPLIMLTDGVIIPLFRTFFEWLFILLMGEGATLAYRYLFYDGGFQTGYRVLLNGAFQSAGYDAYAAVASGLAGVLLNVLIGEYGIFVISFQWIIALILPYVFAFYIAITFLEDAGYLPRISVLFDNIMRKLGVQGGSLIHVILALGCAVPAILGSRTATTQKEKKMIAAVICFAVPCISQIGALAALFGAFAWWMPLTMFAFALFLFITVAFIAGKIIKGTVDPLIIEVPNLLLPNAKTYLRKLTIRMKHFLHDAEVPMLAAVFLAAVLAGTGVLNMLATQAQIQQIVSGWLGMPEEAVVSLVLGIVRREMSVAPLLQLNLTHLQAFVAGVVSLLYLPCLSVFGILAKEFKIRFALAIFIGTVFSAIFVGGLVNQLGQLIVG